MLRPINAVHTAAITVAMAAAIVAMPAKAQTFTIQDQNASFTWSSASGVGLSSNVGFSASDCNMDDHLFAWHWCLALQNQPAFPLRDNGHGAYTQLFAPRRATQSITDVDSRGSLDATVLDEVRSTGPHSGYVRHALTLTNRSGAPLTLRAYLFVDADYNGTSANYTHPSSNAERFVLAGGNGSCGGCFESWADQPDRYQVNSVGASSSAFQNIQQGRSLQDRGLPFASPSAQNDFEGAFEWVLTLAAGQSQTLRSVTGHNDVWVNTPASRRHLLSAVGSPNGTPTINATEPLLGAPCTLSIGGGGSASSATLLFGVGSSATLPNCAGLTVGFRNVLAADPLPLRGGTASLRLRESLCDPTLGGLPLMFQVFILDSSSPACLPLTHSNVLELVFGD